MPNWGGVLDLYYHTSGRLGVDVLRLGAALVEAVNMISQGDAWAEEQRRNAGPQRNPVQNHR